MTTNISPEEVKKFDDMAAQWWDLNGPCKPLHQLNPVRLHFIQNCVSLSHKKVLDVGCGGGILTESLSQWGANVTGIDASQKAIDVASMHASALNPKPEYACIIAEDYAKLHPEQFDILTCMELIEHVPSPLSLLQALSSLLKPGGHLFMSTLNRTAKSFLMAIVGAEYILRLLPKGTHEYEKFIRPSELVKWAKQFNLNCETLKGVSYKPLQRGFELSNDLDVNYLIHFSKEKI